MPLMSVNEIREEELPLEPDEFTQRLISEVEAYAIEQGWTESQFDDQPSDSELINGLLTRLRNELGVIEEPLKMAKMTDDPTIFIQLCKQMEDEAKHARLLAQRIMQLGGNPAECYDMSADSADPYWDLIDSYDTIHEKVALIEAGGERMAGLKHENEVEYFDDDTRKIYSDVILPDESFHTDLGERIVRKYCTDEKTQLETLNASKKGRKTFGGITHGVFEDKEVEQ